jgi:Fe-S cluster biogenesis protein NfuA
MSPSAVESILSRVRPFLQADGGDVELIDVEGRDVYVRLTGVCAGCAQSRMTLHFGLESAVRATFPEARIIRLA